MLIGISFNFRLLIFTNRYSLHFKRIERKFWSGSWFNRKKEAEQFVSYQKCSEEIKTEFRKCFKLFPEFLSWKQHNELMEEIDHGTLLTTKSYQSSHFDQVICGYREMERDLRLWVFQFISLSLVNE
jgi:hypothetical protein